MSDALTDIARDQRRSRGFAAFISSLLDFVKDPTENARVQAINLAKSCDDVPRGYWGGQTALANTAPELLGKLLTADKPAWGWLLLVSSQADIQAYQQLKMLSPWPTKEMAHVSYRTIDGFASILRNAMHTAGNGSTFGGNPSGHFEYVVFYDDADTLLNIAESAVCVGSNYSRYTTDKNTPYVWPTSHRLDYLRERQQKFNNLAAARADFAS